jgi:adenine-specific DNA-methyltransferase
MPTLTWGGKDKVVNHHHDVLLRALRHKYAFNAPEGTPANSSGNKIIHGDNLEALKALLPEYEGRVKCIYLDPPYNTGNEGWIYNDNVNDPKIRKWLGQVVGKEGEDLGRHDKWLCMMYPRLKLLHRLLAPDGAMFISIDDVEHGNLRAILDEIFGRGNLLANFVWQSKDTPGNNSSGIAETHNHILAYRKTDSFKANLLARNEKQLGNYTNPDNDERGAWLGTPLTRVEHRERDFYPIKNRVGEDVWPPKGSSWRRPPAEMKRLAAENRIWWGKEGNAVFPMEKKFLSEVKEGVVNQTWWPYQFAGSTRNASAELKLIFNGEKAFDTPKPSQLAQVIISLCCDNESIILDSFAGSGTTAHAVLKLNQQDGGNRKFILIEMMDYAETITAERVRRVISGYGENGKAVAGTGGHFDFYEMGEPIFTEDGDLNTRLSVDALRRYIAFTENIPATSQVGTDNPHSPYLLGMVDETAYIFCYEPGQTTTLDLEFLGALSFKPAALIVYADNCLLDDAFLELHNIIFKKIPRDVMRY